jgi:hypothetical protein
METEKRKSKIEVRNVYISKRGWACVPNSTGVAANEALFHSSFYGRGTLYIATD